LKQVYHGIATNIRLTAPSILWEGLPKEMIVGRYHSWVVDTQNFPKDLIITSQDDLGFIMSLEHVSYDVKGVQFHPESVLTPKGATILSNWLKN
jgi:anthranilate synthase component 2